VLFGLNANSSGLAPWDRLGADNYNAVILARSGAGKSYLAKLEALRSLYAGIEVAVVELVRVELNTVRLHAGIGYVTPDDEHESLGPAIRKARKDGLAAARAKRVDYHRQQRQPQPPEVPDVELIHGWSVALSQTHLRSVDGVPESWGHCVQ